MKVAIIGAGSGCFGRGMLADLFNAQELRGRGLELVLVDIDRPRLERMVRLAERMNAFTGAGHIISGTTDRRDALPGASYVLTAISRERWTLWEQDYRIPLALGFNHILGENGGPGALFHGLRSLAAMIPICRDIEALCPDALLLNFTNPEARVLHAISHITKVRAVGLCHGVFSAERLICDYLKLTADQIELTSAGMNHFYCVLRVIDKRTGEDRLGELVAMAKADQKAPELFRKMAEVFDVFTFPSDDHIGEYLSFGADYHDGRWKYGQEVRPVGCAPLWEVDAAIEAIASGRSGVTPAIMQPSGEIAVDVIVDIQRNRGRRRQAVNVLNTAGYISNLPTRAAVEVPASVDAQGIHPLHVGAVPETMAAYMRTQFAIHELVTEAYRTNSRRLALQALLLDPCVNSISRAEKLLDTMLALQKDYLPPLQ